MKTIDITVREYEPVNWDDFIAKGLAEADIPRFKNFLKACTPSFINRSDSRRNETIPLVKHLGDTLYWNGCVGVFRTLFSGGKSKYDITIRCRSRFDTEDKHYFLAALLQCWVENHVRLLNARDLIADGNWDEIFDFMTVAVFRKQLMDAYKTGIYRAYQYFEDNSERLRGSIDIPRHIRLNLGMDNGRIAMRYRESTPDNPMNHLILHTYQELKQRHPALVSALIEGGDCGAILENLRYLAPSYRKTEPWATAQKLLLPIANPLYDAYEALRDTCLRILDEQGVSVFDAGTELENTFLFYSPDLWENFIEHQIFSRLPGKKPKTQHKVQCFQVPPYDGMTLRPDFVLFRGNAKIVLDAKYKAQWRYFPNTKGLEDDLKQCLVYYTVLQAAYTGVIFPIEKQHMAESHCKVQFIKDDPKKDGSFRVFDVLIPPLTMESYQDWREALANEEKNTARRIQALCEEAGASVREENNEYIQSS